MLSKRKATRSTSSFSNCGACFERPNAASKSPTEAHATALPTAGASRASFIDEPDSSKSGPHRFFNGVSATAFSVAATVSATLRFWPVFAKASACFAKTTLAGDAVAAGVPAATFRSCARITLQ
eukprot:CAMPEP_0180806752 /NCGR_PEP_ID=MMETSP1038_2-20121128/62782_1 /TAXON_ID=632150 /ORGANISM="Azadinium spinosum, Strain 3D9" /LENGTH=123 /DNA_ID=CAMNT_0022847523 /DNA_START=124 /DNA_END=495 /DNA_ORIENTATION=+